MQALRSRLVALNKGLQNSGFFLPLRIKLQALVWEVHARSYGMSRDRADELNRAMTKTVMGRHVEDTTVPLPKDVGLLDLATACHICREMSGRILSNTERRHPMLTADRGVAAHYAEQHFGGIYGLIEGLGYSPSEDDED
jgi:hypothetical protein